MTNARYVAALLAVLALIGASLLMAYAQSAAAAAVRDADLASEAVEGRVAVAESELLALRGEVDRLRKALLRETDARRTDTAMFAAAFGALTGDSRCAGAE